MFWHFLVILLAVVAPAKTAFHETECSCSLPDRVELDIKPFKYDFNCYFTLKRKSSFFKARELCFQAYSHLTTFSSVREMKSVLPYVICPVECPNMCGFLPCEQCNVTVCPIQAEVGYWLNIYEGKYIGQDLREINIPTEILKEYFSGVKLKQSLMYNRQSMFFSYAPEYVARPFCKINCLVRRNAHDLTKSEIAKLQNALMQISSDSWQWNLKSFMITYKINLRHRMFIYDHNSNVFFHWLRLFVLNFELLLQRKLDQPMGVPYWDWLSLELPQLVIPKTFIDKHSAKARNLFRGIPERRRFGNKFVYRYPKITESLKKCKCSLWLDLYLALSKVDFCDFLQQYSIVISRILMLVGNNKEFSISTFQYAIYDPLFVLIMANVDRHFVLWRRTRLQEGQDPSIKMCNRPNITNKTLEPFQSLLMWNLLIKENSLPKLVDSHVNLFYKYDTNDLSVYAKKFRRECGSVRSKIHLWLKIEFHEEIPCSVKIIITVTMPSKNRRRRRFIIYKSSVYIVNHLDLKDHHKFQVCKDMTKIRKKYPNIQKNSRVYLNFLYTRDCQKKNIPRFSTSFMEVLKIVYYSNY